ncbi:GDP-L-fucose synthase family protein [Albimonas pacifica]|uniref:GDP-L-fucose synthase n=1 Tax=Albimonas pacifica TaxID=1114924 RepID=A0A1I3DXD0_9RHOB|nr:GDP-L-fucose synthase [Albimonas pacifica]SFH91293.1 GDP-L-fucose synthase [Albimonas pacifica]
MTAAPLYPLAGRRVFVAGHAGMVGAALVRRLAREDCEVLTAPRAQLDLADARAVAAYFADRRPQAVFLAAARVGGIEANRTRPADFLCDNLAIQLAVIHEAWRAGVEKLMVLGSSCIYPRDAPQPIREEALLSGPLEPTNEAYAVAKIAGLKMAQAYRRQHGADFIAAQPTNLYGPGDNYDPTGSHVLPALIRRAAEAADAGRPLEVWGSGAPLREFLHADDLADALVFVMERWSQDLPINIGSGEEISIRGLAALCAEAAALPGSRPPPLVFDASKPDGTPRKLVDRSRLLALGWDGARPLAEGVAQAMRDWRAGREPRRGAA